VVVLPHFDFEQELTSAMANAKRKKDIVFIVLLKRNRVKENCFIVLQPHDIVFSTGDIK
jgi:hypothetical protein